jgi:hypothetical protein
VNLRGLLLSLDGCRWLRAIDRKLDGASSTIHLVKYIIAYHFDIERIEELRQVRCAKIDYGTQEPAVTATDAL